jgi:tetratricopeptide (TPR) repeat protein
MLCQRGLEWFPQFLPILYLTGEILLKLGFPLGAIAYFERCLHLAQTDNFYSSEPIERSLLGVAPACAIGAAAMELKDWQAAISAYNLALSFDPNCPIAQTQLNKLQTLANPAS